LKKNQNQRTTGFHEKSSNDPMGFRQTFDFIQRKLKTMDIYIIYNNWVFDFFDLPIVPLLLFHDAQM
jgi:hypothetical protein